MRYAGDKEIHDLTLLAPLWKQFLRLQLDRMVRKLTSQNEYISKIGHGKEKVKYCSDTDTIKM